MSNKMKGNDGTGNNVERDNWQTPEKLFTKLDSQYQFEFDCCASADNTKCAFWTDDFLSLTAIRFDIAWMNPPFSRAEEMFRHFFKIVIRGVAIYRCDNVESSIWQDVIFPNALWVLFLRGRTKYEGFAGSSPRFPSALIGYGDVSIPVGIPGAVMVWEYGTV